MANAVTNEKAFIEQLMTKNTTQDSNIATQATTILALSDEFKKLQLKITDKGGRGGIGVNSDNSRKCLKDRYCYSHGYKVSHIRPDCKKKEEGHKDRATHSKNMKGILFNKFWY